jgi:hypothetical protein
MAETSISKDSLTRERHTGLIGMLHDKDPFVNEDLRNGQTHVF